MTDGVAAAGRERMRIVFAIECVRLDGIAVYCARLARALACEVVLLTSADTLPADGTGDRIREAFARIVVVDAPLGRRSLGNVLGIRSLLRGLRPDVLHVHELHLLATLSPAARLAGVPVAGTSHLGAAGSARWHRLAKRLFALGAGRVLCDLYFAISTDIAEDYRQRYRLPAGRIRLVLPGVDVEHFRPPSPDERTEARRSMRVPMDAVVVLQLGRLEEVKRPLSSLDAFVELARRRSDAALHLVYAGQGSLRGALRTDIDRRALDDRVTLGGFADARTALWSADILVLPSTVEGCALVVTEAMACGVVPVRTRMQGFGDQIEQGRTGYGFDPGDREGFVAALASLVDERVRGRMSHAARAVARDRFDRARMARETLEAYRALAPAEARKPVVMS